MQEKKKAGELPDYTVWVYFYLFFSLSVKKATKARKDLQSIHEGNGATLSPHSARPPFFSLSPLSCWPQHKFSSMLPLHCHVFPSSSPSFIFFLYLLCIYVYVFIASCAQAHILYYLRGGRRVLFMQLCLFVFPPNNDSGELLLSLPSFPIVCLLYVFAPRLHAWMALPYLVPPVYFCLFFFVCFIFAYTFSLKDPFSLHLSWLLPTWPRQQWLRKLFGFISCMVLVKSP